MPREKNTNALLPNSDNQKERVGLSPGRFHFTGGICMRKFFVVIFALLCSALVFAGDVAAFEDIGISKDGKYYLFGTYGTTDSNFCGYAEIYTVDIAKNVFVSSAVFKTPDSDATKGKSGYGLYQSLKSKNQAVLDSYQATPATIFDTLYLRIDAAKKATEPVIVTDYEHSTLDSPVTYSFTVIPFIEGSGKNTLSSFYIAVEKRNKNGDVLAKKVVGSPSVKRQNVNSYRIDKIITDSTGTKFVILIEKTMQDTNGPSIRYMVETFSF